MKYLHKTWVRILCAILAASFMYEFININSEDPNHLHTKDNSALFILLVSPVIYFLLTKYIRSKQKPPFMK